MKTYHFSVVVTNVARNTYQNKVVKALTVNEAWEAVVKTLPNKNGIVSSISLTEIKDE